MYKRILSGCLFLLLATAAVAQDEVDILSRTPFAPGARAAGMAGAFSALADDYTALYYNPAGLAGMKRMELSASGFIGFADNFADIGTGTSATTDDSFAGLSHFGLVLPLPVYRGGISFALGYHRLVDFHQPYGINAGSSSETRVEEEGGVSAWAFGFGFQMSRRFWGGLTLELLTGEEKYLFTSETAQWEEREFSHLAISGTRITLGGLFHITDQLRAAMQIRTPVNYSWTWEEYRYELDHTDPANNVSDSALGYDYKVKIPFELTTGVAWQGRWLSLDADFIFTDWSQAQYDDYFEDTFFEANQTIDRDYEPGLGMRLGAEYNIPTTDLRLRAGVARYPYAAGSWEELTPRVLVTGGIGYLIDQVIDLNLAIGYQRSEFEYEMDGIVLHEDRSSVLISCGLYYRFQP